MGDLFIMSKIQCAEDAFRTTFCTTTLEARLCNLDLTYQTFEDFDPYVQK